MATKKATTAKAETKTAAKKTTAKAETKATAKKAETKTAATAAKKTETKAAVAKTTAAKKPAAKKAEPKFDLYIQFGGATVSVNDIEKNVKKVVKGKKAYTVYVKPEEGVAYFTVNGEGSPDFKINL